MKEIRIVLNNDRGTFRGNEFSIYIDDVELTHLKSFSLYATKPDPDEKNIRLDEIITYNVELSAPYFEDEGTPEKHEKKSAKIDDYDYFVKQLQENKAFDELIKSITTANLTKKISKDSSKWEQEV